MIPQDTPQLWREEELQTMGINYTDAAGNPIVTYGSYAGIISENGLRLENGLIQEYHIIMRIERRDEKMRYLTSLFLIIVLSLTFIVAIPVEGAAEVTEQNMNWNSNDIMKISISVNIKPIKDSRYCYEFSTTNRGEIIYIDHLINAFNLIDDDKTIGGGDIPIVNISIIKKDAVDKIGFISGRFYDSNDKQYAIDPNEYNRFFDFIYALKTKDIVLNDEVSFEPSEWAKTDIVQAKEDGLVPMWNQIGYTDNITRLEVCQFVDNLLEKKGYIYDINEVNQFADTSDKSVVRLYNMKILNGKTETLFCPYDLITREEFAKILSNTYTFIKNETVLDSNKILYKDQNKISDWAMESVSKMTSLGMFKGNENDEFEPQNSITKKEVIVTILRLSNIIN